MLGVLQMVLVALKPQLSKQQVAMAGSQLGSQSALQIAKGANLAEVLQTKPGVGASAPHTDIWSFFFF